MNLHLFLLNLKLGRFGFIAWAAFLGVYGALVVYLYPSIDDASGLIEQLEGLPQGARRTIGLSDGAMEAAFPGGQFSFAGALTTDYLIWIPVFVGIYALVVGSGVIGREMSQGVIGTLLSLPLRRYKYILSKSLAFTILLVALGTVSWGAVVAAATIIDVEVSRGNMALALTIGFLLVLAIFSYSLLISTLLVQPRSALVAAVLVTFVLYMLNFMAPAYNKAGWLENGSLFHFYQPFSLVSGAGVSWAGLGVYGGVIIFAHLASIGIFLRRDITS